MEKLRRTRSIEEKRKEILKKLKQHEEMARIHREAMKKLEEERRKREREERLRAMKYLERALKSYASKQAQQLLKQYGFAKEEKEKQVGRGSAYATYKYAAGLVGEESAREMLERSGYYFVPGEEINRIVNKLLSDKEVMEKYREIKEKQGIDKAREFLLQEAVRRYVEEARKKGVLPKDKEVVIYVEPPAWEKKEVKTPRLMIYKVSGVEFVPIPQEGTRTTLPGIEVYNAKQKIRELYELASKAPSFSEKLALISTAKALESLVYGYEQGLPPQLAGLAALGIYTGGTFLAGTMAPFEEYYGMIRGYNVPETVGGVISLLRGSREELERVGELGGFYLAGTLFGELLTAKALEKGINAMIKIGQKGGRASAEAIRKIIAKLEDMASQHPKLLKYVDDVRNAFKKYGATRKFYEKLEKISKKIREWRKSRELILEPRKLELEEVMLERMPSGGVKMTMKATVKGALKKGRKLPDELLGEVRSLAKIPGKQVSLEDIWRLYGADMPYTVAGKAVKLSKLPRLPLDMPPEIYKSLLREGLPVTIKGIKYTPVSEDVYEYLVQYWRSGKRGAWITEGDIAKIFSGRAMGEAKLVGKLVEPEPLSGVIKGVMVRGKPKYVVSTILKGAKTKITPFGKRFEGSLFISATQPIPGFMTPQQLTEVAKAIIGATPLVVGTRVLPEVTTGLVTPFTVGARAVTSTIPVAEYEVPVSREVGGTYPRTYYFEAEATETTLTKKKKKGKAKEKQKPEPPSEEELPPKLKGLPKPPTVEEKQKPISWSGVGKWLKELGEKYAKQVMEEVEKKREKKKREIPRPEEPKIPPIPRIPPPVPRERDRDKEKPEPRIPPPVPREREEPRIKTPPPKKKEEPREEVKEKEGEVEEPVPTPGKLWEYPVVVEGEGVPPEKLYRIPILAIPPRLLRGKIDKKTLEMLKRIYAYQYETLSL